MAFKRILLRLTLWIGLFSAVTGVASAVPSAAAVELRINESREMEGGNVARADEIGRQAVAMARQQTGRPLLLQALLQSAHAARAAADYAYTLDAVKEGIALAETLRDARTRAALLEVHGAAQWNRGDLVNATGSFVESLRIAETLGDKELLLDGHSGLGLVCARSDDWAGALYHLNTALYAARDLGDKSRIAAVLNDLGNLAMNNTDYAGAKSDFEEALNLSANCKDLRFVAFLLLNLGEIATETGDQATAALYLDRARTLCQQGQIQRGIAGVDYLQAAVDRRLGRPAESLVRLQDALAIADQLKNPDLFASIYEQFALTMEALGDYHGALDYQRKYEAQKEALRGDKVRRQADEIQSRYAAEARSRQIKLLQRDGELQQADLALKNAELSHARSQRYAFIALFALSAAAVSALISRLGFGVVRTRRMLVETQAAKQQVEEADALKARLLDVAALELSDSETRFRTAFEHSALGLALVAPDGRWLSVNAALCAIVGYRQSELMETNFQNISHPDDLAVDLEKVDQLLKGDIDAYHLEKRYIHKSGRIVWVSLDVSLVRDSASGEPRYFISQICDITASREADERLRAAKEEAERANSAKSEFLSRMSHELRTPLNAILGFGQLLGTRELGRRSNESVTHILTAGRHLLGLIDEVLDLAKIESGRLHLTCESASLFEIGSETLELVRPLAMQAGVELQPLPRDDGLHAAADPRRLKQILLNLLSNAIKYNRPGGDAALRWHRAGDRVRLEVGDTGPGIAPEDRQKIGTPFSRLAATEAAPGTGLGLSLTRALAEAMGGEFGFSSEVGAGSVFWVELAVADTPEEVGAMASNLVLRDTAAAAATGGAVLYIEDNLTNLQLVEHLFEQEGIRLMAAMQGRLGIELAREHSPDLILLDMHLPDMMGEAVLMELAEQPATAEIPVIVISADATPARNTRARELGARDYLTKPFDICRLRDAVREVLLQGTPAEQPA